MHANPLKQGPENGAICNKLSEFNLLIIEPGRKKRVGEAFGPWATSWPNFIEIRQEMNALER